MIKNLTVIDLTVGKMFNQAAAAQITYFSDDSYVETWWDRHSRNYITVYCDKQRNQLGDADYSGHKTDAKLTHEWKVKELVNLGKVVKITKYDALENKLRKLEPSK